MYVEIAMIYQMQSQTSWWANPDEKYYNLQFFAPSPNKEQFNMQTTSCNIYGISVFGGLPPFLCFTFLCNLSNLCIVYKASFQPIDVHTDSYMCPLPKVFNMNNTSAFRFHLVASCTVAHTREWRRQCRTVVFLFLLSKAIPAGHTMLVQGLVRIHPHSLLVAKRIKMRLNHIFIPPGVLESPLPRTEFGRCSHGTAWRGFPHQEACTISNHLNLQFEPWCSSKPGSIFLLADLVDAKAGVFQQASVAGHAPGYLNLDPEKPCS